MACPLLDFPQSKHRVCVAYLGPCEDHLLSLLMVRDSIERQFPGMEMHIAHQEQLSYILGDAIRTLPLSQVKIRRNDFLAIKQLSADPAQHPVLKLLRESSLKIPRLPVPSQAPASGSGVFVTTEARMMNESIPDVQIKKLMEMFVPGRTICENPNQAGSFLGLECAELYRFASAGKPCVLVDTGKGGDLICGMFPEVKRVDINGRKKCVRISAWSA